MLPNVLADSGYIDTNKPNLGCGNLSGLFGLQHLIRQMKEHVRGYKIGCPMISGPQTEFTYIPNATRSSTTQMPHLNSSLPFQALPLGENKSSYTLYTGHSADIPVKFRLEQGYKMAHVALSLSGVPFGVTIFINPNESDPIFNQISKEYVANGTLHIYVDSDALPGKYYIAILGEGSVNDPQGREVDLQNVPVGLFHLDITENANKVWMKLGAPTLHQLLMSSKVGGGGTMNTGFGSYTEVPLVVYSTQKKVVRLGVEGYPANAYYKFVPDTLVATSKGANATLIMAGAGIPNPDYPNALHTDVAKVVATSQVGNYTATDFLPVRKGQDITILHGPGPINLTNSNFGGGGGFGFKIIGALYDPPVGSSKTMQVHLSVLGLANGSKVLPLPPWLHVNIPNADFTLGASRPHFFMVNYTATSPPSGPYSVAIDENVGGTHFTESIPLPGQNSIHPNGLISATPKAYKPPLNQLRSGAKIGEIQCNYEHYLLVNRDSGMPACVKLSTIPRLLGLGWKHLATYLDYKVPHSPLTTRIWVSEKDFPNCKFCQGRSENYTVMIGTNNTVRWINNTPSPLWIRAAPDGGDRAFVDATIFPAAGHMGEMKFPAYMYGGQDFEYTFTKTGKFLWHMQPPLMGWVTVLPHVKTEPHLIAQKIQLQYLRNVVPLNHTLAIYLYPANGPSKVIHVANPSNETFNECQVVAGDNGNITLARYDTVNPSFYDQLWFNSTFTPNTAIVFSCKSPHESVSYKPLGKNPVTYGELDRIHTFCTDPQFFQNGSDTLIKCPLPSNVTSWLHMSPPVYKREVCRSTYGCSGEYVYPPGNETDLISPDGQKHLISYVEDRLNQTKSWPEGWRFDNLSVMVGPRGVAAYLEFVIPVVNPTYGYCGWYAQVGINLESLQLYDESNMVPRSNTPCTLK